MEMKQIRLLDEFKRYLYLLPPQNDRSVWVSIGMAIKSVGGGINDFERFSKLGDKYEAGECFSFKTFKTEGNAYGLEHLKKMARICNPEKYKDLVKTDLFEYFELDYQNTNLIEDKAKFVEYKLMMNFNVCMHTWEKAKQPQLRIF